MKILGVDFGTKRVGLALAETAAPVPVPWRSEGVTSLEDAVRVVAEAVQAEAAELVVVGLPRSLRDQVSPAEVVVRDFVARLAEAVEVPVETEDERLTSAQIESDRKRLGLEKGEVDVDAAAAALILESYLARLK